MCDEAEKGRSILEAAREQLAGIKLRGTWLADKEDRGHAERLTRRILTGKDKPVDNLKEEPIDV